MDDAEVGGFPAPGPPGRRAAASVTRARVDGESGRLVTEPPNQTRARVREGTPVPLRSRV